MTTPSPATPRAAGPASGDALRSELAAWLLAIDECVGNDSPSDYLDHERSFLARNRGADHFGDCTKVSCSCVRCICNDYLSRAVVLIAGPLAPILADLETRKAIIAKSEQAATYHCDRAQAAEARLAEMARERDKLSFADERGAVWRPVPAWAYFDAIQKRDAATATAEAAQAENGRLRATLGEIIDYSGGADSALDDEYVMERARAALAQEAPSDG